MSDWCSYGQRDNGLGLDALYHNLKSMITRDFKAGMMTARDAYREQPDKMRQLLTDVASEYPEFLRMPVLRNHLLQLTALEKRIREHHEQQGRLGMNPGRVYPALPSNIVLPDVENPIKSKI